MINKQLIGLPLEDALLICDMNGLKPVIVETRSPKDKSEASRSARVVAVRQEGVQLYLVVAFFSNEGPKEAQVIAG